MPVYSAPNLTQTANGADIYLRTDPLPPAPGQPPLDTINGNLRVNGEIASFNPAGDSAGVLTNNQLVLSRGGTTPVSLSSNSNEGVLTAVANRFTASGALSASGNSDGNTLGFYSSGAVVIPTPLTNGSVAPMPARFNQFLNGASPKTLAVTFWGVGTTGFANGIPFAVVMVLVPGNLAPNDTPALLQNSGKEDGIATTITGTFGNFRLNFQNLSQQTIPTPTVSWTQLC
jgi:hypothetical protein